MSINQEDEDQILRICKGNRARNTQSVTYAVKFAFERKKITFPKYIDLGDIDGHIKKWKDFLKMLDKELSFGNVT